MCNGTITTDEEITTVFKFGAHSHVGDPDFISAERAKCTMKETAKKKLRFTISNLCRECG